MICRIAAFFVLVGLVYGCSMRSEVSAGGSVSKPLLSKEDFAYDLIQRHIGDIKVGLCTRDRIKAVVGVGEYTHTSGSGYTTEYIFYDNGRLILGFGGGILHSISFLSDKLVSVSVSDITQRYGEFRSETTYYDEDGQQGRVLNPDDHVAFIAAHGGQIVGLYMGMSGQSYAQYLSTEELSAALDAYKKHKDAQGMFERDLCVIL